MFKLVQGGIACLLLFPLSLLAQQPAAAQPHTMTLRAFANTDGTDLTPAEIQLKDNGRVTPLLSVKRVTPAEEPVHVILVVDAVNIGYTRVAYARQQVQKFLRANGGKLALPTTFAVVTDRTANVQKGFSTDGNALSDALGKYDINLRIVGRDTGFWGADERVGISLRAFRELTAYASTIPGRKLVIWVSPGWPLLSGGHVDLSNKQQDRIFADVVTFSKELQQANLTLYNINPLGPEESLIRADFYQAFLKGVSKPSQTDVADLSLQVLAVQSGGRAFVSNSDVAGNIEKSLADARSWFELTFPIPPADRPNEYHHLELQVNRPGTVLRARDGYYLSQ